jgi:hypothetical protein
MIKVLRITYFLIANFIVAIYFVPIFIINLTLTLIKNSLLLLLFPISYIALIIYGILGFFLSAFGGYENLVKPVFLTFYKWQVYAAKRLSLLDNTLNYPTFISLGELEEIEESVQ